MPADDWTRKLLKVWKQKRSRRKDRFNTDSLVPQLAIKRLEERLVLNADAAPVEILVVNAGDSAGDGQADIYQVYQEADYVHVSVNGKELHSAPVDSISAIHVNGSADNDVLVADLLAGVDLVFDGGGGEDSLSIHGGEYDLVAYDLGAGSTEQIEAHATDGITRIDFQGVEKVTDSLASAEREFTFHGPEHRLELGSAEGLSGSSRLSIHGEQDTMVDFSNPTHSLKVDTTHSGGGNSDRLEVVGLGDNFDANLQITGSESDLFLLTGDLDLGANDLTVSTGSIVLNRGISSHHAEINLDANTAIEINAQAVIQNEGGQVHAAAPEITLRGTLIAAAGFVEFDSGDGGVTLVEGVIDVSNPIDGGHGGTVHLLGGSVGVMEGAWISAAGHTGGGTILIGGGYQGSNSQVRNANYSYIGSNVVLNADATVHGTGGKIIVWANEATRYYGHASARGAEQAGDGGFVEVSGKQGLVYEGTADLRATAGDRGTLLLDPTSINISLLASVNVSLVSPFTPLAVGASNLLVSTLTTALALADVTVQTSGLGAGAGDLTVVDPINVLALAADQTLTLLAHGSIIINGSIINTSANALNLVLQADTDGVGGGNVDINANITTLGGSFSSSGVNFDNTGGAISTAGGDILIDHTGTVLLGSVINVGAGDLGIVSNAAVTQTAAITGSGLFLQGNGSFTLNNTGNNVATIAANTGGTISYVDANALTVGEVTVLDGTAEEVVVTGITTTNDAVTLRLLAANANLTVPDNLAGVDGISTAGGNVTLIADNMALGTGNAQLAVNAGAGIITVRPNAAARPISLGSEIGTSLSLTDAELDELAATTLRVGSATGAAISITGAISPANITNLVLLSGATVSQTAASTITVARLGLDINGTTMLGEGNDVDTFAASNDGAIFFLDIDGLAVGTVDTIIGITTSDDDVRLVVGDAAGENLAVNGAIALGAGNLLLDVAGDVTQSAAITATGLALLVDGNTTLNTATNNVATIAANNGGTINYTDADSLTVGSVTVLAQPALTGITTIDDDVRLVVGTAVGHDLAINGAVALGAGDLLLDVAGNVTQTAAISAARLALVVDGNTTLESATNNVATIAANNGGTISYTDANSLNVGTVTVLAQPAVTGITTTNDDVTLRLLAGGANLTVPDNLAGVDGISTAGGNVTLIADNMAIGTGNAQLAVDAGAGTVTLQANAAARAIRLGTNAGASLNLTDSELDEVLGSTLTIGSLTGGAISIEGAISPANITNLVLLSAGNLSQTASSTITVARLGLDINGTTMLGEGNDVDTFAANTDGTIFLQDVDDLTIGTVNTIIGITTSDDDVRLNSVGLTINNTIGIGVGDLAIDSDAIVTQTVATSGGGLLLEGMGLFTLTNTANNFARIAASTDNTINYVDANGLTVDTVTVLDGQANELSRTGITTIDDDVRLVVGDVAGENLAVNGAVALGAGNLLLDVAGNVTQTAAITAARLALVVDGNTTLESNTNNVATIAANTGGTISYVDANALTVGEVTVLDGTAEEVVVTGITTTNDAVTLRLLAANANLTVPDNLAGVDGISTAGGNVTLIADNMALGTGNAQLAVNAGAGIITVRPNAAARPISLGSEIGTSLSLTDAELDELAATTLRVGSATGAAISITGAISPANITNLVLLSGATVSQTAASTITVARLGLDINGTTMLGEGNDVDTFAASNDGAIFFLDIDGLAVGTVDTIIGITTSDDDVRLVVGDAAGENLAVNGAIALGAGNLLLDVAGDVTQSAAITATGLALLVDGNTTLNTATNNVATIAANNGGTINYTDADSLTVGSVTVLAQPALTGITTIDDDVRLVVGTAVGHDLAINGAVALGAGDLLLDVAGNVTQMAAITAAGLALVVDGNTTLESATNNVATIAANNGGTISYTDANSLNVGTVTVLAQPALTGITTTNDDVRLVVGTAVGHDLAINEAVALGTGNLLLDVAGAVTQTAAISALGLALIVDGNTTLNTATNNLTTLAANTGGTISYTDANSLNVGIVTVLAQPAVTGITTTGDDVRLVVGNAVGHDLAVNGAVALGAGDLLLDVAGNVTQTAAISALGLALIVDGNTTLNTTTNSLTTLAANTNGTINYTDANSLNVGTVTVLAQPALTGITTTGDDVRLVVGDVVGEDLVISAMINLGAGDLMLLVAGDVMVDANVTTTSGIITISAGRNAIDAIRLADGITLSTSSGMISNAVLANDGVRFTALDMSKINPANMPLTNGSTAIIDVLIQENILLTTSFRIQVDWRTSGMDMSDPGAFFPIFDDPMFVPTDPPDDVSRIVADLIAAQTLKTYQHVYDVSPDGEMTAFVYVPVRISQIAGGTINLNLGGENLLDFEQAAGSLGGNLGMSLDLDGIVATDDPQRGITTVIGIPVLEFEVAVVVPLPGLLPTPTPPPLPPALAPAPAPQLTSISVQPFQPSSTGVTSDAEERYYELRIFTFDESKNEFVESESLEEKINLNDERLKAITPFDPSRLPELFKRLPSDRYRIYLIEDDTERLMIEFVIEQVGDEGHPVELPETIDVEVQPAENGEDTTLPDEQVDPAAGLPRLQLESLDRNEPSFAERLGRASFVSSGGVLFGAAMLSKPTRQSREKRADRRMASFRKRIRSRASRSTTTSSSNRN